MNCFELTHRGQCRGRHGASLLGRPAARATGATVSLKGIRNSSGAAQSSMSQKRVTQRCSHHLPGDAG